ncbi:MAG: polyamine aminopropyltransferase [Candidatus Cloacimonadia bacterium]
MELWYTEKHSDYSGFTLKVKETLYTAESEFQKLTVLDTYKYGKVLLLDGLVMLTESDEFVYHEMISHPALYSHPNPEKVLIIGGGDGGTLREVVRHSTVKKAVLAEIDEIVVEASRKFFPQLAVGFDSPKAEIQITDGIKYVKETSERFDLIIVDSTDPIGPAEGLFNFEFYENCSKILTDDGLIVTQSETPFLKEFSRFIPTIQDHFRRIFPINKLYLANIPTYPTGLWCFSLGSKKYNPVENFQRQRYLDDNLKLSYYNDEIHRAAFSLPNFVKELTL